MDAKYVVFLDQEVGISPIFFILYLLFIYRLTVTKNFKDNPKLPRKVPLKSYISEVVCT